ncbi:MAG TPA: hypothetical protein V6C85_23400 [Allocoleopsis sp.]
MKPELQRIETALNQLAQPIPTEAQRTSATVEQPTDRAQSANERRGDPSFSVAAVQPFPARSHQGKTPTLPKLKPVSISEHRHAANPALATTLLQEIQEIVERWQKELKTTVRQIQDIYLEGPIVDGWLESHPREPEEGVETVRRTEGDRLMDYVAEEVNQSDTEVICETPRTGTGYRLCGLDADGQFWSRPCPADQVPSVSLAIARYQKIRQLLNRKQVLETRLTQLAETLIVMHSHISKD